MNYTITDQQDTPRPTMACGHVGYANDALGHPVCGISACGKKGQTLGGRFIDSDRLFMILSELENLPQDEQELDQALGDLGIEPSLLVSNARERVGKRLAQVRMQKAKNRLA